MTRMEPSTSTVDRTDVSESPRTHDSGTFKTARAPSDRHFEQEILPDLVGSGPILPMWLRRLFRRKHTQVTR
jgi:hypothetical protein